MSRTTTLAKSAKSSKSSTNPLQVIFSLFKGKNPSHSSTQTTAHDDHHTQVTQAWSDLKSNYSRLHIALDELQAQEGDVIEFSHLAKALDLPDNLVQSYFDTVCFTCIDERAQKNVHNALSVGVPGNFCLEKNDCPIFAKKIIVDCQAAKVKKIKLMPHAKCGAATLAVKSEFEALGWDTSSIPDILIDKKAIDYAERMANTITETAQRMNYELEVEVEFIGVQEIEPRSFHNAIGSMVNVSDSQSLDLAKPHLDPKLFNENIDPMFNISGFGNDETIVDRIKLSIDIAFGGHGLGEEIFSAQNPYLILMVADSKEAITRAKNDIIPLLRSKAEQRYADKVVETYILDISDFKI